MVPAGKMFMHGLSGSSPHRVGVLPDLQCDVDQRNDDGDRSDDLSEIREVVQIHVKPSSPSIHRTKSSEKPRPISSQTSLKPGDWMYFVMYRAYGRQCASGMSPKS